MSQRKHIRPGDRLRFAPPPCERDLLPERVLPASVAVASSAKAPSTLTARQGQYLAFIYYYTFGNKRYRTTRPLRLNTNVLNIVVAPPPVGHDCRRRDEAGPAW